jgi:hypothetical protein
MNQSGGSNSVVECDLAKVEVAGSNPVSRSREFKALATVRGFAMKGSCSRGFPGSPAIGRGSQVVRQRSAKPLFASSILARASKILPQITESECFPEFLMIGLVVAEWGKIGQNRAHFGSKADKKRTTLFAP